MKALNYVLGIALLGGIFMTIITPTTISILFTPPVSFGTNCEPAAAWSMSKLVTSQFAGVILGGILGLVLHFWLSKRRQDKEIQPRPTPVR